MMNHILLCNCLCIAWILPKITCIHGVFRVRANTCDYWFLMKGSTAPPLPRARSIMGTSSHVQIRLLGE